MTQPQPVLDADIGVLRLGDETFDVVEELAGGGREPVDPPTVRRQVALLRSSSVLDSEGRFHPSLASTIAAIRQAETELMLTDSERVTRIWLASARAALLLPVDDTNLRRLTDLPVWALPEAVSRLVGLGPRPRPAEVGPVSFSELRTGEIRRQWTLARVATGDGEPLPGASIEVVDTEGGLWVVEPGDDGPTASPSDPTGVWRAIIRLVRPRGAAPLH